MQRLGQAVVAAASRVEMGVLLLDQHALDGKVSYANAAAAKLLGRAAPELIGVPIVELLPEMTLGELSFEEPLPRLRTPGQLSLPGGGSRLVEVAVARASSVHPRRTVVCLFDLSERQRDEDALKRSEQHFRKLVDMVPESVWIDYRGKLVYANVAALEALGYASLEEALGKVGLRHVAPAEVARVSEHYQALLRGEQRPPIDVTVLSVDGRQLDFELSAIAFDFEGRRSILTFGRDVRARRRLEQRIAQNERLSILGMMAGGVAQGIQQPLGYVLLNMGHLELTLARLLESPQAIAEAILRVQETHHGVEQIASLVRQMRTMTRTSDAADSKVQFRQALVTVMETLTPELRSRAELHVAIAPVTRPLWVKRERAEQLVLCLLSRIVQPLPPEGGGRIVIQVDEHGEELHVALRVLGEFGAPAAPEVAGAHGPSFPLCSSMARELGATLEMRETAKERNYLLRFVLPAPTEEEVPKG